MRVLAIPNPQFPPADEALAAADEVVASLEELTLGRVEACLGRQDAVVELAPDPRRARADAQALELVLTDEIRAVGRRGVEHLDGLEPVVAVRNALAPAEDEERLVLLRLDLGLRREPEPAQLRRHTLAELRFREQQEVIRPAAPDDERRDHAPLRREEERLAGVAEVERLDLVRDHPLEVAGRLGAGDAHEGTGPPGRA
jgi:hypothetical protein